MPHRVHASLRAAWLAAAGAFLTLLCALPLLGILYAANAALLDAAILVPLIAAQYPLFLLIRRYLPPIDRHQDNTA